MVTDGTNPGSFRIRTLRQVQQSHVPQKQSGTDRDNRHSRRHLLRLHGRSRDGPLRHQEERQQGLRHRQFRHLPPLPHRLRLLLLPPPPNYHAGRHLPHLLLPLPLRHRTPRPRPHPLRAPPPRHGDRPARQVRRPLQRCHRDAPLNPRRLPPGVAWRLQDQPLCGPDHLRFRRVLPLRRPPGDRVARAAGHRRGRRFLQLHHLRRALRGYDFGFRVGLHRGASGGGSFCFWAGFSERAAGGVDPREA
ncbi:hypothetical protein U1Q18_011122 [Sarracenia purpurea var. burkii]